MDVISVTALIVAIIGAVGHFVNESHLQKCKVCFCIESDCRKDKSKSNSSLTPPDTPVILEIIDIPLEINI
jgi:hypothetical protein